MFYLFSPRDILAIRFIGPLADIVRYINLLACLLIVLDANNDINTMISINDKMITVVQKFA